jgi:hypothetical protein
MAEPWIVPVNWGVVRQIELVYFGITRLLEDLKVKNVINPRTFHQYKGYALDTESIFLVDGKETYTINSPRYKEAIYIVKGTIGGSFAKGASREYISLAWQQNTIL